MIFDNFIVGMALKNITPKKRKVFAVFLPTEMALFQVGQSTTMAVFNPLMPKRYFVPLYNVTKIKQLTLTFLTH